MFKVIHISYDMMYKFAYKVRDNYSIPNALCLNPRDRLIPGIIQEILNKHKEYNVQWIDVDSRIIVLKRDV